MSQFESVSWEICTGSDLAHGIKELSAFRVEKTSWIVESNRPTPPLNHVPAWHLHVCQIPPELVDGTTFWAVPWPQSCRAAQSSGCPARHAVSSTEVSTRRILCIWKVRSLLQEPLPYPNRADLKVVVVFWKVLCIKMRVLGFSEDFF